MIVGIPKEIKANENRVGITPAGVASLCAAGHKVLIEHNAGLGSSITDEEYQRAGASIANAAEVWTQAGMIIKVKEPLEQEYQYFRSDLILFTYLHLAAEPQLTAMLVEKGVTAVAYETVQLQNRTLPLLTPMSEVAGCMAVQIAANLLSKHSGGLGILLGGVSGVSRGHLVVLGGGVAGTNAAKMAVGLGARVTILDRNIDRLRYLDDLFGGKVETLASNSHSIATSVSTADAVISTVLIPGARAPKLVTEEMVKGMKDGSVIVDVAIDQGGSVETSDHATTHENPTYVRYGVVHYCVANMPGDVPRTATFALTNATIPYALQLANKGWQQACRENAALALGVNTAKGKCTYAAVAEAFDMEYVPLNTLL